VSFGTSLVIVTHDERIGGRGLDRVLTLADGILVERRAAAAMKRARRRRSWKMTPRGRHTHWRQHKSRRGGDQAQNQGAEQQRRP